MKPSPDPLQTSQRLRVGLIGLAAVVLLIALASMVVGPATRTAPPADAPVEVAFNLGADNGATGEPLAELGATPGTVNSQVAAAR